MSVLFKFLAILTAHASKIISTRNLFTIQWIKHIYVNFKVLLKCINRALYCARLTTISRKIQRFLSREINQTSCQFFATSAKYTCVGLSDRTQRARVHLSPCAPQIILRVSRFNLRLCDCVARSRRRQSPPLLIRRSNESEWPLLAVPGSSTGSCIHPTPVNRRWITHSIVNRSFEPAASIRRPTQQAPMPTFYAPKWFSISPRINAIGDLLQWNWMRYVTIIRRWHHVDKKINFINLLAKGETY